MAATYTITKEFRFEAAHYLPSFGDEHPCSVVHGHSYRVILELTSHTLTKDHVVIDYHELRETFGEWVHDNLDHSTLNDVLEEDLVVQPTAELVAMYIFRTIRATWVWGRMLSAVTVKETDGTGATYRE